jgi:hypothetical protein
MNTLSEGGRSERLFVLNTGRSLAQGISMESEGKWGKLGPYHFYLREALESVKDIDVKLG